jgi:hypothetical protein
MHHEGDLLLQAPDAATSVKSAAQEVILRSPTDGTVQHRRWIEAKQLRTLRSLALSRGQTFSYPGD